MNILFIGPYRQCDGWGFAARDYIRTLLETKHNIVCKPIFLGKPDSSSLHPSILKHERKTFDSRPDVVIQNLLPPYMDYQYGMKNIGLCYTETLGLKHTSWIDHLNLMDEVWVPTLTEKTGLLTDGVTVPIEEIRMPIDTKFLDSCDDKWPLANAEETCIFYTISEYSERKNIEALIIAFYREFNNTDPVQLLLKLHKPGVSEEDLYKLLADDIWKVKQKLKLYDNNWGYPEILLAIQKLSPQNIVSIHNQCDCFVMPSRGESACRPLMDAIYVGNRAIYTSDTGMDNVPSGTGIWAVESTKCPTIVNRPPIKYIYTAHETWSEISIIHLQQCMREAFQDWKENPSKFERPWMKQFSYKNIAETIEKKL